LVRVVQKVARGGGPTLRGLGLTGPQFDALATVGAHEGLTQQELADRLGVTKGNVSQVLARLEGAGLVERRADGAANQLALSAAGRRLVAEALPGHDAHIDACFAALTAAEREQLLRLLTKLDRALD
jgi:DNA-binding MarR family transcriptional regulator